MALAVVVGASGCCGSIPLSLRCGGSEWVSAAARGGRRGSRGLALRARMRGTPHLRHLTGASPATPPLALLPPWALLAGPFCCLLRPPLRCTGG